MGQREDFVTGEGVDRPFEAAKTITIGKVDYMFALVLSILICNVWQLASNKVTTIIITISFKNTKLWLKLGNLKCNFNAICWVIQASLPIDLDC